MNSKNENFVDVAHRFKWVDNDTVRIINHEGIERLIDVNNGFKELEFNVIPLYNKEWCTWNHYFYDSPEVKR